MPQKLKNGYAYVVANHNRQNDFMKGSGKKCSSLKSECRIITT